MSHEIKTPEDYQNFVQKHGNAFIMVWMVRTCPVCIAFKPLLPIVLKLLDSQWAATHNGDAFPLAYVYLNEALKPLVAEFHKISKGGMHVPAFYIVANKGKHLEDISNLVSIQNQNDLLVSLSDALEKASSQMEQ